ncbi:MAG: hypothetical protein GWN61_12420 [candidate division Zixibacteria bacterium]|nr:metallophosphoesterase [candidate division KSB1 bacterium]NIR64996.1 metallophosphoesterase [candidate division Zixibacteria bacterium]NIW45789.1 hypothetical protein [Gammaproteobacteria bacterium]NIS46789.1 metallophosphoesterase [candidate division Zixibacteria bacterium]NIT72111.1 metallophosphoesterase [candidate division KSB1 bacterium]
MTENQIREIWEMINSLHPQIVLLTGDFVDSSDAEIPAVYNSIKVLKSEFGVFGALGNHDHYATAEKVNNALQQRGVMMLNNSHQTLNINNESLSIVGVDDPGYGYSNYADIEKATHGLSPQSFKILLAHRPTFFPTAQKYGMDLTLSGHTHGGQIGFNFFGVEVNPIYLFYDHARGHYEENGKQLYVNAGVGMVGVPIRLVPREITQFTLHTKKSEIG